MREAFIILSVLFAVGALFIGGTAGTTIAAVAVVFAVLANMAQSRAQHEELIATINGEGKVIEAPQPAQAQAQ